MLSLVVGINRSCSFVASWTSSLLVVLSGDGPLLRIDLPTRNTGEPAPTPIPSASCADAPDFPQIGVWDMSVIAPPSPPASTPRVRVFVNAPGIAVAGEKLRFEVTVTNEGDTALALQPCPNYSISIGGGGNRQLTDRHALNCSSIGPLAPYASATFAMEIEVRGDWPVTLDGGLSWILDAYAGVKLPLGIARRA